MKQSLLIWLLYQVPETILMLFCGLRLLGLRPPVKRFWLAVSVFAVSVPLARLLPLPFGLHTVVLFGVYVAIVMFFFHTSVQTALTAATLANFLLAVGHALVLTPILTVRRVAMADLVRTLPSFLFGAYLAASALIVVALSIVLFRFRLISAPETLRDEAGDREKPTGC